MFSEYIRGNDGEIVLNIQEERKQEKAGKTERAGKLTTTIHVCLGVGWMKKKQHTLKRGLMCC